MDRIEILGPWRNNKNGKSYMALEIVRNSTNAQDGQEMVYYVNDKNEKQVREVGEFLQKFTRII